MGLFLIGGIGIGVALPCLDALITEGIEKEQRGTITSIYSSMRFIGVALGPPMVALLIKESDNMMFYVLAGTCAAALLISFKGIDPPKGE
jgi:ACDE family multidrug resistance protein